MIYFIVFSGLASSIILVFLPLNVDKFYCQDYFWVIIIAILALPLCLLREIKHLTLPSILLFVSLLLFVIVFAVLLGE